MQTDGLKGPAAEISSAAVRGPEGPPPCWGRIASPSAIHLMRQRVLITLLVGFLRWWLQGLRRVGCRQTGRPHGRIDFIVPMKELEEEMVIRGEVRALNPACARCAMQLGAG